MSRYDVYRERGSDALLLDVQASTLDMFDTRVIVPLMKPPGSPKAAARLNPDFTIEGASYVMMTQFISAVYRTELGSPFTNLDREHDRITAALDFLHQGF